MSCCKTYSPVNGETNDSNLFGRIVFFVVGFFVVVLLLPVIWGIMVYFLYNASIGNKENNIYPAVQYMWNLMNNKRVEEEEGEDDEEDSYDDYELLNYEEIE